MTRVRRRTTLACASESDDPPGASVDPGEQLERTRAAALVEAFLAGLTPDQRLVFELFEIEGMRAAEIAEAIDLNINTVYTRLRAARLRFAEFVARQQARDRGAADG